MIELWHCSDARSFRALWTLEELRLPYRLNMLPFPPRVFAKPYIEQNLLGTVPLLVDGETRMTESAAIVQYLATRYGDGALAVSAEEPAYGAWLNWLHFGEATLTFPQTLLLRYGVFEPEERRQPQVVEDYKKWLLGRLRGLEAATADGRAWLCGGRFTGADISVGYALLLADRIGIRREFTPAVDAYWLRVQEREAFLRAQVAQAEAAEAQQLGGQQLEAILEAHRAATAALMG